MSLLPRPQPGGLPQNKDKQVQQPTAPFTYSPFNPDEIRGELYNNVLTAASSLQPMVNKRHTLALTNVRYNGDYNPTLDEEKDAILSGKTLGRPLLGTWTLSDNVTGKPLDSRTSSIASVPHMTSRGTFIFNGVEYTVNHQKRQKPGIYARVKKNGEIESHANILGGDGAAHRYFLDPAKGTFHVNVSQAKIPLMPLLKAMGVSDQQMQEAWGQDLWRANKENLRDNGQAIQKYFERMVNDRDREKFQDKTEGVLAAFAKMKIDPYVSRKTLGYETDKLDHNAILSLTKKLAAISKGEQAPDNRDDLHFQTVVGPAELFPERISKDYGRIRSALFRKASLRGNLSPISANALSRQLHTVILNSGLANAMEEINPGETLDKLSKITSMGEGGLGSVDAIPDSARNVQNSYYGLIDPARTVESLRVGIDGNLTSAIRRGRDGSVYAEMKNVRTGKPELLSAEQMSDSVLALPGELHKKTKRIIGIRDGELTYVNKKDVDYVLPNFERAFSPLGNLVPFKSAMKVHRTTMASRMLTQALPLSKGEAPLVQTGIPDEEGNSYENKYGTYFGAIRADKPGRVLAVNANRMTVEYGDGEKKEIQLYNNFPLNRKTFLHHTPVVQPGDTFEPGKTLVKSNFTDDDGTAAIGVNLRAGYMSYDGYNFEDAGVISRSAAKKMTSEHGYQHVASINPDKTIDKKQYMGYFPSKFPKDTLAKMDDQGVVKVGEAVNYGDPLVLSLQKRDLNHNKIVSGRQGAYKDASETWDHESPGIVTDVKVTKKGITVVVKALSQTESSDKISGRFGDKGVISKIVEDADMPVGADGQPLEVLLNPLGLNSRVNVSQVIEAALGKVAAKTGKPYRLADFDKIEDASKFAFEELKKNGLELYETVYDPRSGRKIPNIMVGNRWMMKLHHQGEGKSQARSTGSYSADGSPAKGGETGAKRLSLLDSSALLAHGAFRTVRDSALVRGQRNEDYWLAFMQGKDVPIPKVPEAYKGFVAKLKGSGINVVEDGPKTNFMALTDEDVDELSEGREITSGDTVQFEKDMLPIKGGLFDPTMTGGPGGTRWAHIKLPEPMPSPAMEEPVRRLLGLTQKQFQGVLSGREKLPNGKSGPQGIADTLGSLNVKQEITRANEMIMSGTRSKRDEAVRRLKYLEAAQRLDIHPKSWLLNKVPVIPPTFRPVSQLGEKKLPMVADANWLYKELLDAKDNYTSLQGQVADLGDERLAIYNSFKAITGLGDPLHPKLVEKKVKGLLAGIFGSSPKHGAIQRSLLSNTVDMVGRGVVIPNPDYDMDTIGIPEDKAWTLYQIPTVRRLVRRGMPLVDAMRNMKDRTDLARKELVNEMDERPVRMVRAPVLHKFGIMAFKPRIVKGHGVQVSPLIVKPFSMDFDGDAVQYHVASTEDEKQEALERLLPSKNLISPANFRTPAYQPSQEYVGGLYTASAGESQNKSRRIFATALDAWRAFERGDISITDPITILKVKK